MDIQLFQDCMFEEFVSCVQKLLRKSDPPKKGLILVENTPLHPTEIVYIFTSNGLVANESAVKSETFCSVASFN